MTFFKVIKNQDKTLGYNSHLKQGNVSLGTIVTEEDLCHNIDKL